MNNEMIKFTHASRPESKPHYPMTLDEVYEENSCGMSEEEWGAFVSCQAQEETPVPAASRWIAPEHFRDANPDACPPRIREIICSGSLSDLKGLLLIGRNKPEATSAACCLLSSANPSAKCALIPERDIIDAFKATYGYSSTTTAAALVKEYLSYDILTIDGIGSNAYDSKQALNHVFGIIESRLWEHMTTIIVTGYGSTELRPRLTVKGDRAKAEEFIRLLASFEAVHFNSKL